MVWHDFGVISQCLVSQPMDGRPTTFQIADKTVVLKRLSHVAKESSGILTLAKAPEIRDIFAIDKLSLSDRKKSILSAAAFAFKRATLLDDANWSHHFRLATVYAKLGRKASVSIFYFLFQIFLFSRFKIGYYSDVWKSD